MFGSSPYGEITDLITKYGLYLDDRRMSEFADLFSDEAQLDSAFGGGAGRKAVYDYYCERMRKYGPTFHYHFGLALESYSASEGRAEGVVPARAELAIDGVMYAVALRYVDTYVREHGRWLFGARRVEQLYAAPQSALPDIFSSSGRKQWPGSTVGEADWPELTESWQAFFESDVAKLTP